MINDELRITIIMYLYVVGVIITIGLTKLSSSPVVRVLCR